MNARLFLSVILLAGLTLSTYALDCTRLEPGLYCTTQNSYELCHEDALSSKSIHCPKGTECLCDYAALSTNPCLSANDQAPKGCLRVLDDTASNETQKRSLSQTGTCAGISASSPTASGSKKIVSYFTNWAKYRSESCRMLPSMINGNLFTHINFAFGSISSSFEPEASDSSDITEQYASVTGLKTRFPHLKVLLSYGGWSFNSDSSTKNIFSNLVASATNRAKFISSSIAFARRHNFDGIDLDWEYPGYASQGGRSEDKPNYTQFLKEFRDALNAEVRGAGVDKLLLTIASPAQASVLGGYELDKIHLYLDWINIMAYDMAGSGRTGFHTNIQEIEDGVSYYKSFGIPANKLILGLATYGHSFTLSSSSNHGVGAPSSGAGRGQSCLGEAGFTSYLEIKQMIANGATEVYDDASKSAYCYLGDQWVGYDNPRSMREKTNFITANGLAGGMIWALDLDAPAGSFSELQCVIAQNLFSSASQQPQNPPPPPPPPPPANPPRAQEQATPIQSREPERAPEQEPEQPSPTSNTVIPSPLSVPSPVLSRPPSRTPPIVPIRTPSPPNEPIRTPTTPNEPIRTPTTSNEPIRPPSPRAEPIRPPSPREEPVRTPSPFTEPERTPTVQEEPIRTPTSRETTPTVNVRSPVPSPLSLRSPITESPSQSAIPSSSVHTETPSPLRNSPSSNNLDTRTPTNQVPIEPPALRTPSKLTPTEENTPEQPQTFTLQQRASQMSLPWFLSVVAVILTLLRNYIVE